MNVWKKLVVLFVLAFLSGCTTTGSVGDKDYKTVAGSSWIHGELSIEGLGGDTFYADVMREGRRSWALTKIKEFCPNHEPLIDTKKLDYYPIIIFKCPDVAKPVIKINSLNENELEVISFLDSDFLTNHSNAHSVARKICAKYFDDDYVWHSRYEIVEEEKYQENNIDGYKLSFDCTEGKPSTTSSKFDKQKEKLEKEVKALEFAEEQKEKEALLLQSVNSKRELCFSMGFEDESEPLANCVLQLMLSENEQKEQQVVVSNDSSGIAQQNSIMNEQTRIMERQLRLQKIEANRENMRRAQYMMKYGKIPMF